jgi:hypothetical protein
MPLFDKSTPLYRKGDHLFGMNIPFSTDK